MGTPAGNLETETEFCRQKFTKNVIPKMQLNTNPLDAGMQRQCSGSLRQSPCQSLSSTSGHTIRPHLTYKSHTGSECHTHPFQLSRSCFWNTCCVPLLSLCHHWEAAQFYYHWPQTITSHLSCHSPCLPLPAVRFSHLKCKSGFSILLPHSQTVCGSFVIMQPIKFWLPYLNSSK